MQQGTWLIGCVALGTAMSVCAETGSHKPLLTRAEPKLTLVSKPILSQNWLTRWWLSPQQPTWYSADNDSALNLAQATTARDDDRVPVGVLLAEAKPSSGFTDVFGWEEDRQVQFATYRSNGPVYFKGKAGYLHYNDLAINRDDLSLSEFVNNFSLTGAVGVGAGYKLSNGERLEIEYMVNKQDVQIFTVGYTF